MDYGRDVVEATLLSLGVDIVRENRHHWGVAFCPLHDDNNPSFAVHMEEGGWRCRAGCGSSGDLAALVEAVTGKPVQDARREMVRAVAPTVELLERILDGRDDEEEPTREPLDYDRTQCPVYMVNRGFSPEILKMFECGFDAKDRSAVLPGYNGDGKLIGLIRRRIDPGREPRYDYTEGDWKSECLFGLNHVVDQHAYLVEGSLDAMWIRQWGKSGVAALGSSISSRQADLIRRRFTKVTICSDNDRAGDVMAAQAMSLFRGMDVDRLPILGSTDGKPNKDVQQMTFEELDRADSIRRDFDIWV